ncbi:MAG: hypothetical protein KatS3mg110_0548 [Pirellulaceae bacterium]|nr:MAG: hypothetical protein KatS3mg110_0548 [Pirellulaceae bacterium]
MCMRLSRRAETTMMAAVGVGWLVMVFVLGGALWQGKRFVDVDRTRFKAPRFLVDLQEAPEAELRLLPDIGPQLARRIVEARQNGLTFQSVEDLKRIKGIGPKRCEALRAYIAEKAERVAAPHSTPTPEPPALAGDRPADRWRAKSVP